MKLFVLLVWDSKESIIRYFDGNQGKRTVEGYKVAGSTSGSKLCSVAISREKQSCSRLICIETLRLGQRCLTASIATEVRTEKVHRYYFCSIFTIKRLNDQIKETANRGDGLMKGIME